MVNFTAALALGYLSGIGRYGSIGKAGGLGTLGKTSILGKLGILFFLGRLGFHGIWGVGAFFLIIFTIIVGILYTVYRHRMSQI
jgi:hypothetical protein